MTQKSKRCDWAVWLVIVGAGAGLAGCGYTDLEMAAKQQQIDALVTKVNSLKANASVTCRTENRPSTRPTPNPELSSR
jgi:phage terminase large subunit-like protein